MNDRGLLEAAAKAAGITIRDSTRWPDTIVTKVTMDDGSPNWVRWNPLADDGDALRLAVKLRISIDYASLPVEFVLFVNADASHLEPNVDHADLMAATRRAITRAAAQIGSEKEEG